MCWVTSTDAPIESPTIQIRPFTTSGNQTGNPPSSASLERVSFASLLLPLASTPCDDISALSVFSEEEEDDDDDSARGVLIITRDVFLVNTPLLFSARRLFPFEDRAKEEEEEDEEDAEDEGRRNTRRRRRRRRNRRRRIRRRRRIGRRMGGEEEEEEKEA